MSQIAYFNNAATTYPKPDKVYDFADKFYRQYGVNAGRGQINSATKLTSVTREMLLDLFHAKNKRVVFTPSATEAINIILRGLPLTDNYTVYVSPFEHNAVVRTLHYLQGIYKINVVTLAVEEGTLRYDAEKIKYQFSEVPPNLVIVSHASNVCGVVAPIQELCTMSHSYGAINVIDMCQTAGLIDIDLSGAIYDFVVFAGHKTLYATFGIAGFICNGDIVLEPLIFGGTGIDSANPDVPSTIPERYEVGSQNILGIAGLYAALEWNKEIGISNIYAKEQDNHNKLLTILKKYENIKVILPGDDVQTVGVVSCVFDGYSSDNIGQILSEQGIEVRTGLHCAPTAHKFLGTFSAGTVRFSVGYFNTNEDFEKLDEALKYICENS